MNNQNQLNSASSIRAYNNYYTLIENCQFQNNVAFIFGGAISLYKMQEVVINNSVFDGNYALYRGGAIDMSLINSFQINNSNFTNNGLNQGRGGAISVVHAKNFIMNNILFDKNYANDGGALQLLYIDKLNFQDIYFINNSAKVQGGAIYLLVVDSLIFFNIIFSNNTAYINGGALFIYQGNNCILKNTVFNNNKLQYNILYEESQFGGGAQLQDIYKFDIINCNFENNLAGGLGGGIAVFNFTVGQIISSNFTNNQVSYSGGAIQLFDGEVFKIYDCNFDDNGGNAQTGGAIQTYEVNHISILDSIFQYNFCANSGGGIYIKYASEIFVERSTFYNNTAHNETLLQKYQNDLFSNIQGQFQGGGIYCYESKSLVLKKNVFQSNWCIYQGGGIYIAQVNETYISENIFKDSFTMYNESIYLYQKNQNYLLGKGGAIYFDNKYQDKSFINDQIILHFHKNTFNNCQSSSGGAIYFNQHLYQSLQIQIKNNTFFNNTADYGPAIRISQKNIDYKELYKGIESADAQNDFQSNYAIIGERDKFEYGYHKNEYLLFGDEFSDIGLCTQNFYLDSGGQSQCQACDTTKQVCEGGYIPIYPNQQYWRESNDSLYIYYCFLNPDNCLKNDTCKDGYKGKMCENCELQNNRYTLNLYNQKTCEECQDKKTLIQFTIIASIFLILIVFYQLYLYRQKLSNQLVLRCMRNLWGYYICREQIETGIFKLVLFHTQILFLNGILDFSISNGFLNTFDILAHPIRVFSGNIVCQLNIQSETDEDKAFENAYYFGILQYFIVISIAQIILFTILIFRRSGLKACIQIFINIGIFSFTLVQPGVFKTSMELIFCRRIGGGKYNLASTNISCTSNHYLLELVPIHIIIITFMGVVLPSILIYIMILGKFYNIQHTLRFQKYFTFLFIDFTESHYLQDFMQMGVRMAISGLSVLYKYEIVIKACCIAIVLSIYQVICYRKKPFRSKSLNQLQQTSLIVCYLSIIFQMCKDTVQEYENVQFDQYAPIFIIALNIIFVLHVFYLITKEYKYKFYLFIATFRLTKNTKLGQQLNNQIKRQNKARNRWKQIRQLIICTNQIVAGTKDFNKYSSILFYEGVKHFIPKKRKRNLFYKNILLLLEGDLYSRYAQQYNQKILLKKDLYMPEFYKQEFKKKNERLLKRLDGKQNQNSRHKEELDNCLESFKLAKNKGELNQKQIDDNKNVEIIQFNKNSNLQHITNNNGNTQRQFNNCASYISSANKSDEWYENDQQKSLKQFIKNNNNINESSDQKIIKKKNYELQKDNKAIQENYNKNSSNRLLDQNYDNCTNQNLNYNQNLQQDYEKKVNCQTSKGNKIQKAIDTIAKNNEHKILISSPSIKDNLRIIQEDEEKNDSILTPQQSGYRQLIQNDSTCNFSSLPLKGKYSNKMDEVVFEDNLNNQQNDIDISSQRIKQFSWLQINQGDHHNQIQFDDIEDYLNQQQFQKLEENGEDFTKRCK